MSADPASAGTWDHAEVAESFAYACPHFLQNKTQLKYFLCLLVLPASLFPTAVAESVKWGMGLTLEPF